MSQMRHRIGKLLRQMSPLAYRTFDRVRFDLECALQRLSNFLSPTYRSRIRGLQQRRGLSINVGSGGSGKDGWVNVDARPAHLDILFTHDIRRPLPLPEGCARRIFAEHVIEHLDFRHDVPAVLLEFHRLLEPGGTIRIVVPDAEKYLQAYVSGDWSRWSDLGWDRETWPADIVTPMHAINHVFHQEGEHFFGYDWETLEMIIRAAKFSRVERMSYGRSLDPELAIDHVQHSRYSLYVDAVK